MIKDALEYLAHLGKETTRPIEIPMGSGNLHEKTFVLDGEFHTLEVLPPPRAHTVESLEDLMLAAERFAASNSTAGVGMPSIFYNADGVQLVIDDADHRVNSFTFGLDPSEQIDSLKRFNSQWLDQKSFLRALKFDLRGTINSPGLLEAIKTLKFDNSATTVGVIDRSKESMGRELKSSVQSKGEELPEEITFGIPIYGNSGERTPYYIGAALETDAVQARLRYCLLPGHYDMAIESHLEDINQRLRERLEDKAHIYNGHAE